MKKTRKMGVVEKVWDFICDLIKIVVCVYRVALSGKKEKYNLKARAYCSLAAALATLGVIIKLAFGSFIRSGVIYGLYSIEKRIAIAWGSSAGDWAHPMSGGRYLVFKALKEQLIATDGFAKFLNDLAGNGVFSKIVQIALIILCFAAVIYLAHIVYRCVENFVWSIKTMKVKKEKRAQARRKAAATKRTVRAENGKVYNIADYRRAINQ
ncbi:MAG: hypothetical protein IJ629_03880 [Clostridia bacterium]|nr:hypothetical protein [Clostridia bacterium]